MADNDPVKVLSDDEVAEIVRVIESSPCATFPMTTEEAHALCATVRVLREQLAENARRHFDDAGELERQRDELKDLRGVIAKLSPEQTQ